MTLPNHTQIPVELCGEVRLSSNLVLQDVLFVPQFKFNLLSASTLTSASQLSLSFYPNHFTVQDANNMMMIVKGDQFLTQGF